MRRQRKWKARSTSATFEYELNRTDKQIQCSMHRKENFVRPLTEKPKQRAQQKCGWKPQNSCSNERMRSKKEIYIFMILRTWFSNWKFSVRNSFFHPINIRFIGTFQCNIVASRKAATCSVFFLLSFLRFFYVIYVGVTFMVHVLSAFHTVYGANPHAILNGFTEINWIMFFCSPKIYIYIQFSSFDKHTKER